MSRVLTAALCASLSVAGHARAAEPVIGLAGPLTGPLALIGQQFLSGASAAADEKASLISADELCTPEGGKAAAEALIAAKVQIIVGFACTESLLAALPLLKHAGIPVISPAIRTNSLTDTRKKSGFLFFRLAPREDSESRAAVEILSARWKQALFAIIDDGTVQSRELAESLRLGMEEKGLKAVFIDTYRPQADNQIGLAGRLRKAGASHVFMSGDRNDMAILARDAKTLNYAPELAGGEALRAAPGDVPLADGILMIGLRDWPQAVDPAVLEGLRAKGIEPDGYVIPAFAALQTAIAAASVAEGPLAALETGSFTTAAGRVKFTESGDFDGSFYRLFRLQDQKFVEAGATP